MAFLSKSLMTKKSQKHQDPPDEIFWICACKVSLYKNSKLTYFKQIIYFEGLIHIKCHLSSVVPRARDYSDLTVDVPLKNMICADLWTLRWNQPIYFSIVMCISIFSAT